MPRNTQNGGGKGKGPRGPFTVLEGGGGKGRGKGKGKSSSSSSDKPRTPSGRKSRAKPPDERGRPGPKPGQPHTGQFQGGEDERRNRGGRPPVQVLRELLREQDADKLIADALVAGIQENDPQLIKLAAGYLYGTPVQSVELAGKDGGPIETKQSGAAALLEKLRAIEARHKGAAPAAPTTQEGKAP